MREKALVISTNGDKAVVQVSRSTACEHCSAKCMVANESIDVKAEVENLTDAQVGDTVDVEMEFSGVMSASAIAYGIPFVAFFAGAALGYYVLAALLNASPDLIGLATGIILIAASYGILKLLDKKGAFKKRFIIKIVK
ncbi:MAG: SoxR reducing system RseC family protein [Anaerofustis sp.]